MRGAGDLLGDTQAGHMKLIGVDLYQHLLGVALRQARGEDVDDWTPELNLGVSGMLPETWIPEPDVRLTLYVRLGRIADDVALDAFEEELVDRFGPMPDSAASLLAHVRLRLAARNARIGRVDAGPSAIALTPRRDFAGEAASHGLVAKNDRLLLLEAIPDDRRLDRTQALLEELAA
jgi:transcription-repair coupling factor (superfamily II helicase)